MDRLVWTEEERDRVRAHGERGYPDEVCGILVGERRGPSAILYRAVPIENSWEEAHAGERHRRFRIDPGALVREERRAAADGHEVLGFYHTHPEHPPVPSETDRDFAWPVYAYVILRVDAAPAGGGRAGEARCWVLRDDRSGYEEHTLVAVPAADDANVPLATDPESRPDG